MDLARYGDQVDPDIVWCALCAACALCTACKGCEYTQCHQTYDAAEWIRGAGLTGLTAW